MDAFTIETRFKQAALGADAIYAHLGSHPELVGGNWRFDRATTDAVRATWAYFGRNSPLGTGRDTLSMAAQRGDDGIWAVTHKIKRAKA
jgi:hypothetical protein